MSIDYNVMMDRTVAAHFNGGSTNYMISASNGYLYNVYVDTASDISFRKSVDHGMSWSPPTVISGPITATQLSVWYDGWSAIDTGIIHVAYVESVRDDVSYRSIDTINNDVTSSATIAFAGASTAAGAAMTICRATGGNLYIVYNIDATTELGFATSSNVGVTWGTGTTPTEAVSDYYMLMPGWSANNQDVQLFFWDLSANEVSVKRYNSTANTWAETSISASMTELALTTAWPNWCAVPNYSGSNNILAAWSNTDVINAKLSCWAVDDTAITKLTDIVNASTDDQGLVALSIDTGSSVWYAYYTGKTDGSEVWTSRVNVYYKTSSNFGASWGPETKLSTFISGSSLDSGADIRWLATSPIVSGAPRYVTVYDNTNTSYPGLKVIGNMPTASSGGPSNPTGNGSISFS